LNIFSSPIDDMSVPSLFLFKYATLRILTASLEDVTSIPTNSARRGRPRNEELDLVVLRAAAEILAERGFDAMTIEDVAAFAGVAKTTIYRRWSTKGALALDAFLIEFLSQQPSVDTGSLESDLRVSLTAWARAVVDTPTGRTLVRLVAEAQLDEQLAHSWTERVMTPLRDQHRLMVERAIGREEIPEGSDVEAIMDMTYGPAYHRLLQGHLDITPSFISLVARTIAEGARAGAAVPRPSGA
jgi:AcrR family transcriptional regulator